MWQDWDEELAAGLRALQIESGPDAGIWHPDTRHGRYAGRLYTTSMSLLALSTPFR